MHTVAGADRADIRVREHFNEHVDLYVDKELSVYRISCHQRFELLCRSNAFHADSPCRVLDIGCGGGLFADLLLAHFPKANLCGVDASFNMIKQNDPSSRKTLVLADARRLPLRDHSFDVISIDTLMHHLIDSRGYAKTISGIVAFLEQLKNHLAPGGVLLVREIYHEYSVFESLGCRLLFLISTLRLPGFLAGLLSKWGIKTANAGVAFLTRRQWRKVFDESGFQVIEADDRVWPAQPYRRFGFRQSGDLHYLLCQG